LLVLKGYSQLVIIDQVSAYRSYAVALKIADKDISSNGEPALWWDLADPYHYIRVTPHKEPGYSLLVVGGEDEKVGQHDDAEARYKRLVDWTRARWSSAGAVEYQWSGQVIESVDG
jgi:glycine/D-amino acid oxidase-like deaminating enzyme